VAGVIAVAGLRDMDFLLIVAAKILPDLRCSQYRMFY